MTDPGLRPAMLAAALGLALAPLAWVHPVRVRGRSMEPGLADGSLRLALRAWCAGRPRPGQIWLVQAPAGTEVKRLVGLPGDRVDLRDGRLWRNGRPCAEPYPVRPEADPHRAWASGPGYFLLGDNRPESCDSRTWGALPAAGLMARIL